MHPVSNDSDVEKQVAYIAELVVDAQANLDAHAMKLIDTDGEEVFTADGETCRICTDAAHVLCRVETEVDPIGDPDLWPELYKTAIKAHVWLLRRRSKPAWWANRLPPKATVADLVRAVEHQRAFRLLGAVGRQNLGHAAGSRPEYVLASFGSCVHSEQT